MKQDKVKTSKMDFLRKKMLLSGTKYPDLDINLLQSGG